MTGRSIGWGGAMLLAASAAAGAAGLTVPELQRLIQSAPLHAVAFEEERESPWLSSPILSRGTMRSTPQALEKRIESPRRETWRLLPDRIEQVDASGRKEILFSQAPALAPLADLMRNVVAGDLASVGRDFQVDLIGDANAWRIHMSPRQAKVARALANVELQGSAGGVQVIIISETNGQRTTTRLAY